MARVSTLIAFACALSPALASKRHFGRSAHSSRNPHLESHSNTWTLKDDHTPQHIMGGWTFETVDYDSSSAATYVNLSTAVADSMVRLQDGGLYLGVDTTPTVSSARNSLRISSGTYNVGTLLLADIAHAPAACGAWPALWMTTRSLGGFAVGGEIDIAEYYHLSTKNSFSVHTGEGCSMGTTGYSGMVSLGVPEGLNCDASATGNAGCGVLSESSESAGVGINQSGGGVYAMEWTAEGISMWFVPRAAITEDITSRKPEPSQWGQPDSFISSAACDVSNKFKDMEIIINTELCGAYPDTIWADEASLTWLGQEGGSCATKTGYATCLEYVQKEGGDFAEAYWLVNSVKVYTLS